MKSEKGYSGIRIRRWIKILILLMVDSISVVAASYGALLLRFNLSFEQVDEIYLLKVEKYLPYLVGITIIVFIVFRLYQSMWGFAGITELENVILACVVAATLQATLCTLLTIAMPRSYYVLFGMLLLILVGASRFSYRAFRHETKKHQNRGECRNVMVIGAGQSGDVIIKEITMSQYVNRKVKCVIDDEPSKRGRYIQNIKIVGNRTTILKNAEKYKIDDIIIAMPSASKGTIREITNICKDTKCNLLIIPGIYQLVNGEVSINDLRKVDISDLLGRDMVNIDINSIIGYVKNKVVLVTGGGGSIGSELCRQLAKHEPKMLLILDIYENGAYDIQQELKNSCPNVKVEVVICSVGNRERMSAVFEKFKPNIIYHAAAHKHVPLMEDSPNEAVENNVFGTLTCAEMAMQYGVERFVMISTDKAVNPTNIMGATKRICEMIIQSCNCKSKTEFVAVRFGNVLGSNGSVIPLFKRQLEVGGPITVTHPDIIRYFMTIPEAVSLVLQAGAYAKGGEIFVLDMGEPVKILDLAENLIRLSGFVPYEDIQIVFTGLRPGEKLYEELLMKEEGLQQTDNNLIFIGEPIDIEEKMFAQKLEKLQNACTNEAENIRVIVKELVPTYQYKDVK